MDSKLNKEQLEEICEDPSVLLEHEGLENARAGLVETIWAGLHIVAKCRAGHLGEVPGHFEAGARKYSASE